MTDVTVTQALEPCPNPWCVARTMPLPCALKREGWRVLCECGVSTYRYPTEAEAIAAWNTRTAHSSEGQGWIVGNGDGTKWRTWGSVGPEWTDDREQATRYARRVDAERTHADDDDAWRIVPYLGGGNGAGEDEIAKIIDPAAWPESRPTDGYSTYWISRRKTAREKAKAIVANSVLIADEVLIQRLHNEADLYAKDGADDICELLQSAIREIERIATLISPPLRDAGMWERFLPMDQWDQRDETVLLLVDYTDGDHPLDDATTAITIGHNNDHNVGDGEGQGWQFAGWCWSHAHYVEGKGAPIGWAPLPHHLAALSQSEGENSD